MPEKPLHRLLVVDDDQDVLLSAQIILQQEFAEIRCIDNPSLLTSVLPEYRPDVVLLDMNFTRGLIGGDEGLYWLKHIKAFEASIQVVMSTAYSEVELAVKAIKLGAADFVQKPWLNEKLIATLKASARISSTEREVEKLRGSHQAFGNNSQSAQFELIGHSASFKSVLALIERVAPSDANVLITGENGTGKELVARAIHQQSQRSQGPMVSVDVGALPATLFESEMFGHTKGAFTDARSDKAGKFELASQGTLFLDEIGNLDLHAQAKLLRALESRSITRVGGNHPVSVDIRLVCATNVNSTLMANADRFRQDLLYRINTVEIKLPPLRERIEDIPLLLNHFCQLYGQKYLKPDVFVAPETLAKLMSYAWPGNIRELRHATERAVIVADRNELVPAHFLAESVQSSQTLTDFNLESIEQKTIEQAIQQYRGNMTQVAKALGLGRTTLYRKLEKYGIANE